MAIIYNSDPLSNLPFSNYALIVTAGNKKAGLTYLENKADEAAYKAANDNNETNTELVKQIITIVAVVAVIFIFIKFCFKKKKQ